MYQVRRITVLASAMLSVSVVAACHKAPPAPPAPVVTVNQDSIDAANAAARAKARADSIAAANARAAAAAKAKADSIAAAEAAARAAAAEAAAAARATLVSVIHFDLDKSDLSTESQGVLDAKAAVLQANPSVAIRIGGHTDERGSDEYNLALGQRRAAAAKAYLTQHGVAESRIETVSYGEERPVAQGSDESAWSQNRRDEFEITAGDQNLKRP